MGAPSSESALMAVKPATTRTPQRVTTQFTVGDPTKTLDTASIATLPNVGSLRATPDPMTLVGADVQSGTAAIGALAAGASASFTIRIPLPDLPTPFIVGVSDRALLVVGIVSISQPIVGLALGTWTIQPQSYTAHGTAVFGNQERLQVSQTYTGWVALISGTLVAVTATAAGTLTARVHATLYDTLG